MNGLPGKVQMDLSGFILMPAKKYLNGWTTEQEKLMAKWADIAGCYRWLHDKAEKGFSAGNAWITIPVIILSTLTGTASFALSSFIPANDPSANNYAQAGIGAVSIFAGILTTIGNFLRYAQNSEAHRVAGVAWGKLHRQITVELAIHPDDRDDSMTFLQVCRQDLDRLVEQSPPIPDRIIAAFGKEFSDVSGLYHPDICHGLEHTAVYNSTKPRLMSMVTDATIYLKQRKKLLREEIIPDLTDRISNTVKSELDMNMKKMWSEYEEKAVAAKLEVKRPEPVPNPSFVANWRRFISRNTADREETVIRDDIYTERGSFDSALVSIQSQSPTGASTDEMVISMSVNPNPTPAPDVPPTNIVIPNVGSGAGAEPV
jgi:hypothetical protein